jgi:hypothetical protein
LPTGLQWQDAAMRRAGLLASTLASTLLVIGAMLVVPTAHVAAAEQVRAASGATNSASGTTSSPASGTTNSAAVPAVHIVTARSGIAPGVLFANPVPASGTTPSWTGGPMIYDNAGHVIWYLPNSKVHASEPITYRGQRAFAYHLTVGNGGPWSSGYWVVLNQSYQQIGVIGYGVDHHELLVNDAGTVAFVDSYNPVRYDLSKYGGSASATVMEAVVYEVNLSTGQLMYEWHSLQHVPVTDTYASLKASTVDYFHINSIAIDSDGNPVLSGKNLSTVMKINRQTGAVMWRLGGKHSTFRFTNGRAQSLQHDARIVGPNTYSVFDNGGLHDPQYSRGVTFRLDLQQRTARVVAQCRHKPDLYSSIEGSNRQLPNGDRLIGWAHVGVATEYSGHTVVFESRFDGASSYRTYRSAWNATPRALPTLAVRRQGTSLTADASWNGATGVTRWEVLGGPDAQHLRVLRTVPYTGFQMSANTTVAASDRVFAVRAVRNGSTTSQSTVATAF